MDQLRRRTTTQKKYGGEVSRNPAIMDVQTCPSCAAGRAKQDGLTHCAYCGHEFLQVSISDGLHLRKDDNSRKQ